MRLDLPGVQRMARPRLQVLAKRRGGACVGAGPTAQRLFRPALERRPGPEVTRAFA